MMITGQIQKAEGGLWRAECPLVGAYTQGRSRKDALVMLADCVEALIGEGCPTVTVTEVAVVKAKTETYTVSVDAEDVTLLLAEVLKHQRRIHKLTVADVAKRLGANSLNAYSAYEQGRREASVGKYRQLLAAVAPEVMLSLSVRAQGPGIYMDGRNRVPRSVRAPTASPSAKGASKL